MSHRLSTFIEFGTNIVMPPKKGGGGGTGKDEQSRDRGILIKTRQPQTTTNDI